MGNGMDTSLSLSLSPFLGWDGRGGWAMEVTRFSLIPFCLNGWCSHSKKTVREKVRFKIGHEELDFSGQGYKGKNNYGSINIPP